MGQNTQAPPTSSEGAPNSTCFFEHTIEVESHSSLKNGKIISFARRGRSGAPGRPFIRTNPKAKAAQDVLVFSLQVRARELSFNNPWGHPLRIVWVLEQSSYWTKGKPKRLNRKAGDLSNLIQNCEDALTKAGIIEDDSLIVDMHASKVPSHRNAIHLKLFPA